MGGNAFPPSDGIEPWLRGPLAGVNPLLAPTLHAYAQANEDVTHWTESLDTTRIWCRPHNLAPVGFHLRHIAGSIDRLTTYLRGEQLSGEQMEALSREMDSGANRDHLLLAVRNALAESEQVIRNLDPATLADPRFVGRKRLSTTVIGLVVHLAEHTQRHVGELIITAKLAKTI